jgi:hypothetical protein
MQKNLYYLKMFLLTLFLQSVLFVDAQWTTNLSQNTSVSSLIGAQKDPRITKDGQGGAFIVWKDTRLGSGNPDIYVQRVNSQGVMLWAINGVGACTDPFDQSTPSIVGDMAGGIIVTWSDWRSGLERDIFAQRLDANGNLLWATGGAIVTNKIEREHNERIISDGAGGCIIAWEQLNLSNGNWDVWAQRLDNNGVAVWAAGGIPLSTNPANKRNPKLQKDKTGGGFITWQDKRNGFEYDIYAQHLDANGNRLWGDPALAVCSAPDDQNNPKIDPDTITGGIYIAWADERNPGNDHDIYCQRIDPDGLFSWALDGVALCNAPGSQTAVDLLSNAEIDGVIATWKDNRSGNTDIYAQRLNGVGVAQWQTDGVPICTKPYPQRNPNISYDEYGGAVIVWEDSTSSNLEDVSAQRINASGVPYWTTNGVTVCNNVARQKGPKSISDKTGGVIAIWEDYRTGSRDVYVQRIYSNGTPVEPVSVKENQNPFSDLAVYPNPFFDQFIVEFSLSKSTEVNISLISIDGREALRESVKFTQPNILNQYELKTDNVSKGIYFLTLSFESQTVTSKIIKY